MTSFNPSILRKSNILEIWQFTDDQIIDYATKLGYKKNIFFDKSFGYKRALLSRFFLDAKLLTSSGCHVMNTNWITIASKSVSCDDLPDILREVIDPSKFINKDILLQSKEWFPLEPHITKVVTDHDRKQVFDLYSVRKFVICSDRENCEEKSFNVFPKGEKNYYIGAMPEIVRESKECMFTLTEGEWGYNIDESSSFSIIVAWNCDIEEAMLTYERETLPSSQYSCMPRSDISTMINCVINSHNIGGKSLSSLKGNTLDYIVSLPLMTQKSVSPLLVYTAKNDVGHLISFMIVAGGLKKRMEDIGILSSYSSLAEYFDQDKSSSSPPRSPSTSPVLLRPSPPRLVSVPSPSSSPPPLHLESICGPS